MTQQRRAQHGRQDHHGQGRPQADHAADLYEQADLDDRDGDEQDQDE